MFVRCFYQCWVLTGLGAGPWRELVFSQHVLGSYSFWIFLFNWMPVQNGCRSRCSLESQELARQRLPKVWHRRLSPVMFLNSCKAVVDSDQCRHVSTNLFLHRSSLGLVRRRNASVWHAVLFYSRCVRYLQYLLILYVIQCIHDQDWVTWKNLGDLCRKTVGGIAGARRQAHCAAGFGHVVGRNPLPWWIWGAFEERLGAQTGLDRQLNSSSEAIWNQGEISATGLNTFELRLSRRSSTPKSKSFWWLHPGL